MRINLKPFIISCAVLYSSVGIAISEQEQLIQARFSLVGIITEKAATKHGKDRQVAVIKDHDNGGKNYTLSPGEYLPGSVGLQIIAMERNEIIIFDGKTRFAISYAGRDAENPHPESSWDTLEYSSDYGNDDDESVDSSPSMVERIGEYRYIMKDGIYTLIKGSADEPRPSAVQGTTVTENSSTTGSSVSVGDKGALSAAASAGSVTTENSDDGNGAYDGDTNPEESSVFRPAVQEKKVWEGLKLLSPIGGKKEKSCSLGGDCPGAESGPMDDDETPTLDE